MMDEVMYGMMPSAKMVRRFRVPPLNKSKMPSAEPCACWKYACRTSELIPGVGMCAPIRYTASIARVNMTRFRRSSMRKRFETAWRNRFMRYLVSLQPLVQNRTNKVKSNGKKKHGSKDPPLQLPYFLHLAARFGPSALLGIKKRPLQNQALQNQGPYNFKTKLRTSRRPW